MGVWWHPEQRRDMGQQGVVALLQRSPLCAGASSLQSTSCFAWVLPCHGALRMPRVLGAAPRAPASGSNTLLLPEWVVLCPCTSAL